MLLISKFLNNNENVATEITEIEKKYSITLSTEHKKFLCKYNGGDTPDTHFRCNRTSSDIRAFYGIGDVRYSLNEFDLNEWIELNVFPIACDSFENYIVIGLRAGKEGKIYFYDHEEGHKMIELAENLTAFLNCCKSKKLGHIRSIEERENSMIEKGRGDIIDDELRAMWQAEIDKYGNMVQEEVIIK